MTEATTKRTLWQRLRYVRIALAWLCGLVVLFALVVVAINLRDEEFTPDTRAWLQEPVNPVAPVDNAFLAVAALQIEQRADTDAGRRMLTAIGKEPRLLLDEKRMAVFGTLWQAPTIDRRMCVWKPGDPALLVRIASQHDTLEKMLEKQRPALDRYYAAIALPDFHEIAVFPEFLSMSSANDVACLARVDLALRVLAGKSGAAEDMRKHIGYWSRALLGSRNLMSAMFANGALNTDMSLLQDLQKIDFEGKQHFFASLRPTLQAVADAKIDEQVMAGELRYSSQTLRQAEIKGEYAAWWQRPLSDLFFKRQASINRQQFLMASIIRNDQASTKQACDSTRLRYQLNYLYNPLGKLLGCMPLSSYETYLTRLAQTRQDAAGLVASIH